MLGKLDAASLASTRYNGGSAPVSVSVRRSIVEKVLQVRAAVDYGSRPLL
jgi:hypothetical protein